MELRILGMNGPFPAAGRACSGYLLTAGGKHFMLDMGSGILARFMRFMNPLELSAVLQSHFHHDHAADLGVLAYYLAATGANKAMPVYAPEKNPLPDLPCFAWRYETEADFFDVKMMAMRVRHPVPAYAFKLEYEGKTFVYTGDTNTCDGLGEFMKGADLVLIDACLPHEKWNEHAPHLSAKLAGELARDAKVKQLVLTHHNPLYTKEALLKEARTSFADACWAEENAVFEI
jgi:Metal-dependent hydrolases of the beta-lactamase superfamily III